MQLYYHIAVPCHGYILGFVPCGSANSTNPMNVHYLRKDMSNMFLYNIFWVLQNSFPSGFMYGREVKMEAILYFVSTMLMMVAAIIIGCLILVKNTKKFHIQFSWKGFEVSGSFFRKKKKH